MAVLAASAAAGGCKVQSEPASDPGAVDAEAYCGNGVVDWGETCDEGIAAGRPGACPSSCASDDACLPRVLAGTGCRAECASVKISKARNDDGCCPAGISAAQDSDCGSCGDGIIGPDEACDPPEKCPKRSACSQTNACLRGSLLGDPAMCTALCSLTLVTDCRGGDACCPAGCGEANDSDCSAQCGDGIVQPDDGETCEPASAVKPCPVSCDDGVACTQDVMAGSAENCNVTCTHIEIVTRTHGDGCCPAGSTSVVDSDCAAVCGNQVRELGESCDPCPTSCDDNNHCTTDSMQGSASACSLICSNTAISTVIDGDGCCPQNAPPNADSDCPPSDADAGH